MGRVDRGGSESGAGGRAGAAQKARARCADASPAIVTLDGNLAPGALVECPIPESRLEAAEKVLAGDGSYDPAVPRLASTVMLLRERASACGTSSARSGGGTDAAASIDVAPLEVFVQRRASTMAFVPGAVVFPGGGVTESDREFDGAWEGPDADAWAQALGCAESDARGAIVAAVRELFEEAGVLLATPKPGCVLPHAGDSRRAEARKVLSSHEAPLAEVFGAWGAVLRSDWLAARARWVTTEFEPRRYDTFFFSAMLPAGEAADGASGETDAAAWAVPSELLAERREGRVRLVPPTVVNLARLAACGSCAEACESVPFETTMFRPARSESGSLVMRCVLS